MQLTSGSTGAPKAVQVSHANVVANAEAMIVACEFDIDSDVIVSWLPCSHDMGMTGYLTVPMYFGAELVKVTPTDFLRDTLLWARLIDKYRGTMTAAPNFAYNLLAKRLRRLASPGEFDLSSLRWALSDAEQVDPLDVEDLCAAGAPFGLRPEAIIPAYGMAETTVAVSILRMRPRHGRRRGGCRSAGDPPSRGAGEQGAHPAAGVAGTVAAGPRGAGPRRGRRHTARPRGRCAGRARPPSRGYTTTAGFVPAQDELGWYDTGDLGYLTEPGEVVVCGRLKDVIIMAGRNIFPRDIERAAARVDGVRAGCAMAIRLDAGHSRETFAVAVESTHYEDPEQVRRIQRQVAHEVVAEVDVRPRNVVVLEPGLIPKKPSGKLRRAYALALID